MKVVLLVLLVVVQVHADASQASLCQASHKCLKDLVEGLPIFRLGGRNAVGVDKLVVVVGNVSEDGPSTFRHLVGRPVLEVLQADRFVDEEVDPEPQHIQRREVLQGVAFEQRVVFHLVVIALHHAQTYRRGVVAPLVAEPVERRVRQRLIDGDMRRGLHRLDFRLDSRRGLLHVARHLVGLFEARGDELLVHVALMRPLVDDVEESGVVLLFARLCQSVGRGDFGVQHFRDLRHVGKKRDVHFAQQLDDDLGDACEKVGTGGENQRRLPC